MGLFSQRVAAFCWDGKGTCYGVLLSRDGQNYKIIDSWSEKAKNQDSTAALISEGYVTLKVRENDLIVAGEMGMKCSFADIRQPLMKHVDMKKSLNFTLSAHFPVDPQDLTWAYRVVHEKDDSGLAHVRLFSMKNKTWNEWVDQISSIKLDRVIAPAVVADAVIDKPAYIAINEEKGFIVRPNSEGMLQTELVVEEDLEEDVFGAGDSPLSYEHLDEGSLKSASVGVKKEFSQVVLLGMYALTDCLKRDKETCFDIPKSLVPKRNALIKGICSLSAVIMLLSGVLVLTKELTSRKKDSANIKFKIESLSKETKRLEIDRKKLESMQALKEEMMTKVTEWASVKDVLSLITEKLPKNFYLSSFQFRSNKVNCYVYEVEKDPNSESILFETFKKVDFFTGVPPEVSRSTKYINLNLTVKTRPLVVKEEK